MSVAAGIAAIAAYVVYVFAGNAPDPADISAWAKLMIIFIGIGVIIQIVVQIAFHIAFSIGIAIKENDKDGEKTKKLVSALVKEDERDKLITLKTSHIGYICAGAGLMIALFALAGGVLIVVALHITAASFAVGSIVEGCTGIYFHERGVRIG